MNVATAAVVLLITAAGAAAVRRILRHGGCGCGGSCASCGHDCAEKLRAGLKEVRRQPEDRKKRTA